MEDMGLSAHHNANLQVCTIHVAQNARCSLYESSWKEVGIFMILKPYNELISPLTQN